MAIVGFAGRIWRWLGKSTNAEPTDPTEILLRRCRNVVVGGINPTLSQVVNTMILDHEQLITSLQIRHGTLVGKVTELEDRLSAIAAGEPGTGSGTTSTCGSTAKGSAMNEMIERVARALCQSYAQDPDEAFSPTLDGGTTHRWMMHTNAARAAISAMREPTREMVGAAIRAEAKRTGREGSGVAWSTIECCWQAMIDRILEDEKIHG